MLEKIKTILEIKQELDSVKQKFDNTSQALEKMQKEVALLNAKIGEFSTALNETKKQQSQISVVVESELEKIRKTSALFHEEMEKFSVMRRQTQSQILQKFEKELETEMADHSKDLKITSENYQKLKEQVEGTAKMLLTLEAEIRKLSTITANIKKEDFEMTKFARDLLAMDREKLDLMRKIDTLERLISRMRKAVK